MNKKHYKEASNTSYDKWKSIKDRIAKLKSKMEEDNPYKNTNLYFKEEMMEEIASLIDDFRRKCGFCWMLSSSDTRDIQFNMDTEIFECQCPVNIYCNEINKKLYYLENDFERINDTYVEEIEIKHILNKLDIIADIALKAINHFREVYLNG